MELEDWQADPAREAAEVSAETIWTKRWTTIEELQAAVH